MTPYTDQGHQKVIFPEIIELFTIWIHARKWVDFFWATIFACFETDTAWSTSISETDKKYVCLGVKGRIDNMCYTVRYRYCAVISLTQ